MSKRSNGFLVALAVVAAATGCGSGDDSKAATATTAATSSAIAKPLVIEGFSGPEAVLFAGDRVYVSNRGSGRDSLSQDGDGFLSELDPAGKVTKLRAMPHTGDSPLHSPKGLARNGNRIFVADVNRIVGYDMDSRREVFEARIGGELDTLLNDIVPLDDKSMLVTDTARGSVYRLDLDTREFETLTNEIPGANGVALDSTGELAYVAAVGAGATGGELWELDLTQQPVQPQTVGNVTGILDGVAVLSNGNIIVSDWVSPEDESGTVVVYRVGGIEAAKVPLPEGVRGSADFTIDPSGRNLWVAALSDNRVAIIPLPLTSSR